MKKKDRELLELRQKTIALNDKLVVINQLSWRIRKAKERFSFESRDLDEMSMFYQELSRIYQLYLQECGKELSNETR